jgi:hypothetical protein
MLRIAPDCGAEIQQNGIPPLRRQYRGNRRTVDSGYRARQNRAIAINAPVLPAETATSASPFLTASIASHIDETLRPRRSAWLGLSCMLTATSVWTTREAAFSAGYLASSGSILARSPTSRNSASG